MKNYFLQQKRCRTKVRLLLYLTTSFILFAVPCMQVVAKPFLDAGSAVTQQRQVSGRVTDEEGNPISGVTVSVKTSTLATMTDAEGNYSIDANQGATLVFTSQGYAAQEVAVEASRTIDVVLKGTVGDLDQVVVVGYGTQRKSDLTGSVVRIDMAGKEKVPNTNLSQALSGYVPGVNATSGAAPGSTGALSIRGTTTLSASEAPLIVIDGIIYNGSLSNINTNDIASIDVLKDASAAAIYGARSAAGVLLITTKRGKSEKPQFEVSTYHGIQDIGNTKRTRVMNAEQFAISRVDHAYQQILRAWYLTSPVDASGRPQRPDITDRELVSTYLRSQEESQNYLDGKPVDWVDEALQTAPIHYFDASISGRTDRTNYYLSASHTDQKGILKNASFQRQTIRANFDNDITDWLNLRVNTSYTYIDEGGLTADLNRALLGSPLANIYTSDGNYTNNLAGDPYVRNPLEDIPVDRVKTNHNLNMAFAAKIKIPWVKGLTYEFNYSKNLYFIRENIYYPSTHTFGLAEGGRGLKNHEESHDWLVNNVLAYTKSIGVRHRINATMVYTAEERTGEGSNLEARGFDNEVLGYNSLEVGRNRDVNTLAWQQNNTGFLARLNYSYNDRYMITGTLRRDGFSGFGANNKYASFPSVGFGWVISEEDFIRSAKWLNFLKLRLTYGLNGNQGIGAYSSLATMASTNYVYGASGAIGIFPIAMGNAGLRWESTASFNVGLDFSVLNQRLSGSLEVYKSNSSDVLVQRTLPQSTGFTQIWDNVSKLQNHGVELSLNSANITQSNFSWNTRFVFSLTRSKIAELYEGVTEDIGNRWFVGEPIAAHFDYQVIGVWQEDDLFKGNIISSRLPGDMKLLDVDKNGIINNEDRSIIGHPDPNFRFGISNDLTWKNFTLSLFINSIQGGNGYYIDNPGEDASRAGGADRALRTNRTALFEYWRPENPVNDQPAIFYPYEGLHGMYFSRAFVRIQDVSLSYNFNIDILNRHKINGLQVYLSGKNLYTWTDWPSYDPELYETTPMMRSVIIGLRASF